MFACFLVKSGITLEIWRVSCWQEAISRFGALFLEETPPVLTPRNDGYFFGGVNDVGPVFKNNTWVATKHDRSLGVLDTRTTAMLSDHWGQQITAALTGGPSRD